MAEAGDSGHSLHGRYRELVAKAEALRDADTRSEVVRTQIEATLGALDQLLQAIDAAGVFSRNEELEDVRSQDLPLLSARFHMALLLPAVQDTPFEAKARLRRVLAAWIKMNEFLALAEHYGIVTADQIDAAAKLDELSHDDRRTIKIARAREASALKRRAGELETAVADADEALIDLNPELEEEYREMHLCAFKSNVLTALDEALMLQREIGALKQMAAREAQRDPRERQLEADRERAAASSSAGASSGPAMSKVTISPADVERMRVFSNPNKPTMSIEEWAEAQMAAGKLPSPEDVQVMMAEQARKLAAAQSGEPDEANDDPDGESDAAVYAAREWDDFKDANPRGSGNMMANNG
ncbi:immunoglobulin-binding protein 1 [Thecamonas trahens ATCC 50062]|uniref:Immunoglobulin-binding protein 1 n=1 Tax=Thecamonas trahens ATCC 50062 TaxID=461836 RepID=A0A0L0DR16_THETB|nr:immunoglobulin-binding protein 1 [Thecamonas trahens ATCC 50062]KNC54715.1 immunoglobulin-binding protein 1 [Thecamonas trahens ATCC 50062]|eukprot:XP_013761615.1 immunoglobulin-binding protein 1 [Thecamonas trahens ATCC 50062]